MEFQKIAIYARIQAYFTQEIPAIDLEKVEKGYNCGMAKQKYYVVWKGRKPGIYTSWEECEAQVKGFTGAEYKSFPRRDMAERFSDWDA